MGELYRILALVALTVVALYAVRKYHQRRGQALEQAHAKHHGWETARLNPRAEVWKCPRCRGLLENWADVIGHQGVESPCGILEVEQAQLDQLERDREAAKDAETAGRWSASAVVGGEVHSGAVDTFTGELEGGQDGDG